MEELEQKLMYQFRDNRLLQTALTHSSYANEHKKSGLVCNERLEYLGDAVLDLIVADYLYRNYPDWDEGSMTRVRAELVCEHNLVKMAKEICLGAHLYLGHGEEHSGGRERNSILADAFEAVLAAMYLDGGIEPVKKVVNHYFLDKSEISLHTESSDYKTELQEKIQQVSGQSLQYVLVDEQGPDHDKRFTVEVLLNGSPIGRGDGRSKKAAEQAAARAAIADLNA